MNWIKTNMTRLRGWAPRARSLQAPVPHGHWKALTFIAALRADRLTAPFVIDGAMNGEWFLTYVAKVLIPTLEPGDVEVPDNLGSHKGKAAGQSVREAGARLLFLPAYSPDLNPIEQVFAKLKTLLRKLDARTIAETWRSAGRVLGHFAPDECLRYLKNCGYAST